MSARHFNYYDDWQEVILECPKCRWQGTFEQGSVSYYDELMDCECPNCDCLQSSMLAIVNYPTLEEIQANVHRPGVREWLEQIDKSFEEFEREKLKGPEQLPELDADQFVLTWDVEVEEPERNARTVIKHEGWPIVSEPARWEEFKRFEQVAEILAARYGERLKDLVPTVRSELWLLGDDREAADYVWAVRKRLFGHSAQLARV